MPHLPENVPAEAAAEDPHVAAQPRPGEATQVQAVSADPPGFHHSTVVGQAHVDTHGRETAPVSDMLTQVQAEGYCQVPHT